MIPKISIIIPVYNGELYLSEAIESCLTQTFKDFEIIIVNDCSTDTSLKIAEKYKSLDDRITIINNELNKKLPATLNVGHNAAKGDYITWTSDDNILKPNFLEKLLAHLVESKADLVYSNYDIIYDDGKLKRKHLTGPTEHLLFGNVIGASFLYKRIVFETLKGYQEHLFLLEDFDFWLRASRSFRFSHLNDNLYQYRLHFNSLTAGMRRDSVRNRAHNEGIVAMFSMLAVQCSWHPETTSLLIANFKRETIDIVNYLTHKEIIKSDLFSFNSSHLKESFLLEGLLKSVRRQLVSEKGNQTLKMFLSVLKKERLLLFHLSFSKKVSIRYIKECIFK